MYILLVFRYFLQTDRSPFRRRFQKTWEIKKITKLRIVLKNTRSTRSLLKITQKVTIAWEMRPGQIMQDKNTAFMNCHPY